MAFLYRDSSSWNHRNIKWWHKIFILRMLRLESEYITNQFRYRNNYDETFLLMAFITT